MRSSTSRESVAVVGLLRVHREPGVVLDAVLRGAARLEFGELAEVVLDAVAAAAVPAGPERRLGDRDAAGQRHLLVVVGGARHHVRVMIDVLHERASLLPSGRMRRGALLRSSRSSGSVVGSLRSMLDARRGDRPAPERVERFA